VRASRCGGIAYARAAWEISPPWSADEKIRAAYEPAAIALAQSKVSVGRGAWIAGAVGEETQWEVYMRNLRVFILALSAGAIFTLSVSPAALAGGKESWQQAKAALISQFPSEKDKFKDDFGDNIAKLETIYGQIVKKDEKGKISSQWPEAIKLATLLKTTIASYKGIISSIKVGKEGDAKPGKGVAISLKMDAEVNEGKAAKDKALDLLQEIQKSVDNVVTQCKKVTNSSSVCG
jgi:hypothetical protein